MLPHRDFFNVGVAGTAGTAGTVGTVGAVGTAGTASTAVKAAVDFERESAAEAPTVACLVRLGVGEGVEN